MVEGFYHLMLSADRKLLLLYDFDGYFLTRSLFKGKFHFTACSSAKIKPHEEIAPLGLFPDILTERMDFCLSKKEGKNHTRKQSEASLSFKSFLHDRESSLR